RAGKPWVLTQPDDRGTAAAILLAAHWIAARDASATLVVFPCDHRIVEEAIFMGHVEAVTDLVAARLDWTVLLGARPQDADAGYGWIEPGTRVGETPHGPLYRVRHFVEKPTAQRARTLHAAGAFWNTLVLAASPASLIEAGRQRVPAL